MKVFINDGESSAVVNIEPDHIFWYEVITKEEYLTRLAKKKADEYRIVPEHLQKFIELEVQEPIHEKILGHNTNVC